MHGGTRRKALGTRRNARGKCTYEHVEKRKIPGSNPACAGIFRGSSHTSDLQIDTPVAALPGAWHYRASAGTGRPGVSIL